MGVDAIEMLLCNQSSDRRVGTEEHKQTVQGETDFWNQRISRVINDQFAKLLLAWHSSIFARFCAGNPGWHVWNGCDDSDRISRQTRDMSHSLINEYAEVGTGAIWEKAGKGQNLHSMAVPFSIRNCGINAPKVRSKNVTSSIRMDEV